MANLQAGKTYKVHHSRKGEFVFKVDSDDGPWVTGTIVEGGAEHLSDPDLGPGDSLTVRKSLATFTEVE